MDYEYTEVSAAMKEQASDEDTEDASEAEVEKKEEEFTGIKEQMYQDKLAHLKHQLEQLRDGTLPLYTKKLKKLTQANNDRVQSAQFTRKRRLEIAQEQFEKEQSAARQEFEEKRLELKERLIQELEQKKKSIEHERAVMELTGDTMAVKPVTTRKLRRRPNDPMPVPEKRGGKPSPVQLTSNLDEAAINDDLYAINRITGKLTTSKLTSALPGSGLPHQHHTGFSDSIVHHEASIEDGRLLYDKKWFSKDQTVVVESTRDTSREKTMYATIVSFTSDEVLLKKIVDNCKMRISIAQLQSGFYTLKKRTNS